MPQAGTASVLPRITREQAVAYRLRVNHLVDRLPEGSYEEAAYAGLQDTAPRDALLGMHARVGGCGPSAWEHPSLIQTYSPRQAVYVLPRRDFGVFTIGRLPLDPDAIRRVETLAERVCRALAGRELRGAGSLPGLRRACASGRIALRWTTSALWVREIDPPDVDIEYARLELCRRHVRYFGPTTPATYGWWAGLPVPDARQIWDSLSNELLEVDFEGTPRMDSAIRERLLRTCRHSTWNAFPRQYGSPPVRARQVGPVHRPGTTRTNASLGLVSSERDPRRWQDRGGVGAERRAGRRRVVRNPNHRRVRHARRGSLDLPHSRSAPVVTVEGCTTNLTVPTTRPREELS